MLRCWCFLQGPPGRDFNLKPDYQMHQYFENGYMDTGVVDNVKKCPIPNFGRGRWCFLLMMMMYSFCIWLHVLSLLFLVTLLVVDIYFPPLCRKRLAVRFDLVGKLFITKKRLFLTLSSIRKLIHTCATRGSNTSIIAQTYGSAPIKLHSVFPISLFYGGFYGSHILVFELLRVISLGNAAEIAFISGSKERGMESNRPMILSWSLFYGLISIVMGIGLH